jgi:hypothetical protein
MSVGNFLSKSGLNMYFNATFGLDALRETENAATTVLDGVWNNDPNTFQRAGTELGFAAGSIASLGLFGIQGAHGWYSNRINDTWMVKEGSSGASFYHMNKGKMFQRPGPNATTAALSEDAMKSVMSKGKRGRWVKNIGFKALKSGWKGPTAFFATLAATTILPPVIGGVAGKIMDSGWQEAMARRQISYDNRFFDTRQQEMSAYQTIGASMQAYHGKLISTSRIYHHAG